MYAEPKQHISHSTVEKQRRDRINSLIDEVLPIQSQHFQEAQYKAVLVIMNDRFLDCSCGILCHRQRQTTHSKKAWTISDQSMLSCLTQ